MDVGRWDQEISKTNSKRWLEVRVRKKKTKLSESGLAVHMLELEFELAVTQFELAFELAPEQFELDFDLAAAASDSNSNSRTRPPPGEKKKTFPSMHSRSSSERLRAVSREVRCQELIFFRIRLRGGDMACYQRKHPGNNFLTWLSEG